MLVGALKTVLVDDYLYIREYSGEVLSLIYDDTIRIMVEESLRVGLYLCQSVGILKTDVRQLWEHLTAQCGLARLARSSQCNNR